MLPNSLISSDERETETTGDSAAVIGGCSRVSRSPSRCSGGGAPCSGWPAPPLSRLIRDHKLANMNTYLSFFFFSFQHGCALLAPPPGADTPSWRNQLSVWRAPRMNGGLHIHAAPSKAPFWNNSLAAQHTETHTITRRDKQITALHLPNWNLLVSGKREKGLPFSCFPKTAA